MSIIETPRLKIKAPCNLEETLATLQEQYDEVLRLNTLSEAVVIAEIIKCIDNPACLKTALTGTLFNNIRLLQRFAYLYKQIDELQKENGELKAYIESTRLEEQHMRIIAHEKAREKRVRYLGQKRR